MKDIVECIEFVAWPCPSKISRSIFLISHAQPIIVSHEFLVIVEQEIAWDLTVSICDQETLVGERCRVSAELTLS